MNIQIKTISDTYKSILVRKFTLNIDQDGKITF